MNLPPNPFQLKKHADDILEIIVNETITPQHKVFAVLQAMAQKFAYIIFTLEEPASLHPSLEPHFPEIQLLGSLLIVANPDQISFPLHGIRVFTDVHAARTRIRNDRAIEATVRRIVSLPALGGSVKELLHLLLNPEVTFEQIEELTNKDQLLVGRMLKIANNSLLGNRMKIDDLKTVVKFLGIEGIRQILVQEIFNVLSRIFVRQHDKLAHMRRCSALAAHVGKLIGLDITLIGKIKAAGLMHDVGALAMSFYAEAEYIGIQRRLRPEKLEICEAEKSAFGFDHQEIGEKLARELSLPAYVISAVGQHHNQEYPEHDLISMSVMVANGFLNEQIEQVCATDYEKFMPILSEEREKNQQLKPGLKPAKPVEISESGDEAGAEPPQDLFSSARVCALLKEELDNIIMASQSGDI